MRQTEFCHFGPFFALLPLPTWKIKILKKGKKQLEMPSFYICVPKMMIIWCMIPEIWSAANIIFSPFAPFFATLLLPNNPENQNFEKRKNTSWDIIILHIVYQKWSSWRMIPEIWNATDIIFCHFGPFSALLPYYWPRKLKFKKNLNSARRYYPLTHAYLKWRSYDVWFLRHKAWWTEFCVTLGQFFPFDPPNNPKNQNVKKMKKTPGYITISHFCTTNYYHMMYSSWDTADDRQFFVILDYFLPFYPSSNLENQNFEKIKKSPGDIIILHLCIINENRIMYGSWDMEHNRQNFWSFWAIFCPFTQLTIQKIKILKKWKKHLQISSFYTSVPKIIIICYTVPEIRPMTDVNFIFHFGLFFAHLMWKKKKKWKQLQEISSFYTCVPKIMIRWCMVPEKWCATDGWTDKWKKWHRGGCPNWKLNH